MSELADPAKVAACFRLLGRDPQNLQRATYRAHLRRGRRRLRRRLLEEIALFSSSQIRRS